MAGFDYGNALDAVMAALRNHNTSTASPDLSGSLTSRIADENILEGDPNITIIRQDRLPAVFVRISNSEEEFASIGTTGPTGNVKYKTVIFDIFGIYQKEGASSDYASVLRSVSKLAQNIEGVFQANMRLSNTALWCNPRGTAIANVPVDADGSWVKTIMIEVEARYFFR